MIEQIEYSHCEHCGFEYSGDSYNRHPNRCPECRHSKDWQWGRTANCQKCEIYQMCHEPIKELCPKYQKTCAHFKPQGAQPEKEKRKRMCESMYVEVKCRYYLSDFCFEHCKKRVLGCAGEVYHKPEKEK